MAHGLEARVPYLDKEIVEYVERLPARFKVRNGSQKWLHRQVAHAFLPKAILKRKKRGFAVNVVDEWFRGAVGRKMEEMLLDRESQIYRYLRPETVQDLFKEHRSGRSDNHKVLFSLVVFEEWLKTFSSYAHVA
jgi:asparagine synthase (glutamine-hydrolysing)